MNVVIFGAGNHKKFGARILKKFEENNHNVIAISHMSKNNILKANFSNPTDVVEKFKEITKKIDKIDLIIYNTSINSYPNEESFFKPGAVINEKLYNYGLLIHVVIPHMIAVNSMNKLGTFIFMTSQMAFDIERDEHLQKCGYTGGKNFQHQLMQSLAAYNDPIFTSLSVFEPEKNIDKIYDIIINIDSRSNGKIIDTVNGGYLGERI